jgi:predicted HTH transcriptional regulator
MIYTELRDRINAGENLHTEFLGLVTDAGSGIPRMIRLIKKYTGQDVAMRLEANEFVVAFVRI